MGLVTLPLEIARETTRKSTEQARLWCKQLEEGNILLFPQAPIALETAEDLQFLLGLEQSRSVLHKNLAYQSATDRIVGANLCSANSAAHARLRGILRSYSQQVTEFLTKFLTPYQSHWQVDYTSFRAIEEQGRHLPLRKRNDLLHIDAFPTRPTQGARILRFFQNIHPTRPREWIIGEPFRALAPQFAPTHIALPRPESAWMQRSRNAACRSGMGKAIPALQRSSYDRFMLRFHNFLKENSVYQSQGARTAISFPPGSSWMIYTDTVPHAVLSGQYALEQTFLVAPQAMVAPEHSPLAVLESLVGQRLL